MWRSLEWFHWGEGGGFLKSPHQPVMPSDTNHTNGSPPEPTIENALSPTRQRWWPPRLAGYTIQVRWVCAGREMVHSVHRFPMLVVCIILVRIYLHVSQCTGFSLTSPLPLSPATALCMRLCATPHSTTMMDDDNDDDDDDPTRRSTPWEAYPPPAVGQPPLTRPLPPLSGHRSCRRSCRYRCCRRGWASRASTFCSRSGQALSSTASETSVWRWPLALLVLVLMLLRLGPWVQEAAVRKRKRLGRWIKTGVGLRRVQAANGERSVSLPRRCLAARRRLSCSVTSWRWEQSSPWKAGGRGAGEAEAEAPPGDESNGSLCAR